MIRWENIRSKNYKNYLFNIPKPQFGTYPNDQGLISFDDFYHLVRSHLVTNHLVRNQLVTFQLVTFQLVKIQLVFVPVSDPPVINFVTNWSWPDNIDMTFQFTSLTSFFLCCFTMINTIVSFFNKSQKLISIYVLRNSRRPQFYKSNIFFVLPWMRKAARLLSFNLYNLISNLWFS